MSSETSALDIHNIEVCNVRFGADHFFGRRDYTRKVSFPHPKGVCCICYDEGGLKMKCGHYICPEDILENAWYQIIRLIHQITCVCCTAIIDIDDIIKFGLPSEKEQRFLTTSLSVNLCSSEDIQQCLTCRSHCERQRTDSPQVICLVCTQNTGKRYLFCWYCLRSWKNSPTNTQICGNLWCNKEKIDLLLTAPLIEFKNQKGEVVTVPNLRACPRCRSLIELNGVKNRVVCRNCDLDFCFICLNPRMCCSYLCKTQTWIPQTAIDCTPAPIQKKLLYYSSINKLKCWNFPLP